jgi:hypothetical protein
VRAVGRFPRCCGQHKPRPQHAVHPGIARVCSRLHLLLHAVFCRHVYWRAQPVGAGYWLPNRVRTRSTLGCVSRLTASNHALATTPPPPVRTPSLATMGRTQVIRKLGGGTYARCLLARRKADGVLYAIKQFREAFSELGEAEQKEVQCAPPHTHSHTH